MHPELIRLGPISVHAYGLFLALAFVVAGAVTYWQLRRRGVDASMALDLLLAALVGGLVGAKLHYVIANPEQFPRALWSGEGLIWYGGLIGGTLAVLGVIRWRKYPLGVVADCVAPAIAAAYAVGRIGCFLNGCCYGRPCGLPWAMEFPVGVPPTSVPVHPTQLYESLASLLIFAVLVWVLAPRLKPAGALFFAYLALAGVERLAVEFVRTNPAIIAGLTQQQLISIGAILLGVGGLVWLYATREAREAVVPATMMKSIRVRRRSRKG